MSFLYSIFGFLLRALYQWVGNYGLALILLTLFARILMLPMSIKQQKSTAKMQRLQSKVRKIQQQYAGDQKKIQEETARICRNALENDDPGEYAPVIYAPGAHEGACRSLGQKHLQPEHPGAEGQEVLDFFAP